jgi:hypothetical protein
MPIHVVAGAFKLSHETFAHRYTAHASQKMSCLGIHPGREVKKILFALSNGDKTKTEDER